MHAYVQACFSQKVQFVNQWLWRRFGLVVCNPKISLEFLRNIDFPKISLDFLRNKVDFHYEVFPQWQTTSIHQPSLMSEAVAMVPLQTTSPWPTLHTLAEVKGCFILRPWAYKLWEQIQVPSRFPACWGVHVSNTLHYNKISIILQPPSL